MNAQNEKMVTIEEMEDAVDELLMATADCISQVEVDADKYLDAMVKLNEATVALSTCAETVEVDSATVYRFNISKTILYGCINSLEECTNKYLKD